VVQLLPQVVIPLTKPSSLRPPNAGPLLRKEPPTICLSTRHANGMPAVTLRRNGTGSFSWPSGGLAASADLDPVAGYRLMAMYQGARSAAAVALSADAGSGFAQYPTGLVALAWKRGDSGSYHSPGSEVQVTWSTKRCEDTARLQPCHNHLCPARLGFNA
jgi:hypothetical protein